MTLIRLTASTEEFPVLDVINAGFAPDFVPYLDGWAFQRKVHAEVVAGDRPDTLILVEHEPVYTAGRQTHAEDRPAPDNPTPVVEVDRGGQITWHGPGQLVGYPIVRLSVPIDVVAHVRRIEKTLIGVLAGWGIEAFQVEGRSGVWVRGDFSDNKIAAIGIRVSRRATMHGFALNCNNSLNPFTGIVPCGISDAGVTSISRELGRDVSPAAVADSIVDAFGREFAGVAA